MHIRNTGSSSSRDRVLSHMDHKNVPILHLNQNKIQQKFYEWVIHASRLAAAGSCLSKTRGNRRLPIVAGRPQIVGLIVYFGEKFITELIGFNYSAKIAFVAYLHGDWRHGHLLSHVISHFDMQSEIWPRMVHEDKTFFKKICT